MSKKKEKKEKNKWTFLNAIRAGQIQLIRVQWLIHRAKTQAKRTIQQRHGTRKGEKKRTER
jgi:hypothetical protein